MTKYMMEEESGIEEEGENRKKIKRGEYKQKLRPEKKNKMKNRRKKKKLRAEKKKGKI